MVCSVDAAEEGGGPEVERASEPGDRGKPGFALGAFEERDLRAMHAGGMAERLLGETAAEPLAAEVLGELLARFHPCNAPGQQTKPLQTKPLGRANVAVMRCSARPDRTA
jgi:hypothetical protein